MSNEKQEKPEEIRPDCILSDGTEIFFDKHKIKPREWRSLFDVDQKEEEGQRIMANFSCVDFEYIRELSMYDWQVLIATAIKVVNRPVPNSLSVSTGKS